MLDSKHIGFISTRINGTDGVSLETKKWTEVLEGNGHGCYFFAGELDCPNDREYISPESHFTHPRVLGIQKAVFGTSVRDQHITNEIHALTKIIKNQLYDFTSIYQIDILLVQNALSIPMNIPLGIAITEFISETGIPTIAHHHDFYWERERFLHNSASEYLHMAFPPQLPSVRHVTINSIAAEEFSHRTGASSTVIPNVMDFDNPPNTFDVNGKLKSVLGIEDNELVILQPTRIVQRKRIERAIEIVQCLGRKAVLLITHPAGDEGYEYEKWLAEYSEKMGVRTLFVSDFITLENGDMDTHFTLEDMYKCSDLVTYPSTHEGFGNAFIEAVYYKKPIVINKYPVYHTDISPKNFKVIEIDDMVTDESIQKIKNILDNEKMRDEVTEYNYSVGARYFSYSTMYHKLVFLMEDLFGMTQKHASSPDINQQKTL